MKLKRFKTKGEKTETRKISLEEFERRMGQCAVCGIHLQNESLGRIYDAQGGYVNEIYKNLNIYLKNHKKINITNIKVGFACCNCYDRIMTQDKKINYTQNSISSTIVEYGIEQSIRALSNDPEIPFALLINESGLTLYSINNNEIAPERIEKAKSVALDAFDKKNYQDELKSTHYFRFPFEDLSILCRDLQDFHCSHYVIIATKFSNLIILEDNDT